MIDPNVPDPLRNLPDSARIWIYAADRDLNDREEKRVAEIINGFCASWTSHGRAVESAANVIAGRFAVIAGRIPGGDISGCGIDASVHALDRASSELGLDWLPSLYVHFRDAKDVIHSLDRSTFRGRVENGDIDAATHVFDLSIEELGQLRGGRFERPAGDTWHGQAFRITEPVS